MTIIGLGNTGCNIAEKFESISGFNVLLIDSNIEGEENCISIKECNSPEEYENTFPDLTEQFKTVKQEICLIVGGSGKISGASLSLLKQLRDKKINVVYIRPDLKSLNTVGKLQDKLVFNVFQEYTRSGIFNSCYIISNTNSENILGDLPIIGFFDKINEIIYNLLSYAFIYRNKKGVMNNLTTPKEICRIKTIGVFDLLNEKEDLLYNMQNIDNKHYYFIINEDRLKTDNGLLKKIKEIMQDKSKNGIDHSYAIFSTTENISYCFVDVFSKRIQE